MRAASPYATNNTGAPPPPTFMGGAPPPPPQQSQPQSTSGYPNVPSGPNSGGYTLPPTVAYFPVTAYGTPMDPSKQSEMMSQESLNVQQPNTPDLLMHRRQVILTFLFLLWLLIGLMLHVIIITNESFHLVSSLFFCLLHKKTCNALESHVT